MSIKKHILQWSKESLEYISIVIPSAVSQISPNTPPEIAAIFATAIKSTCVKIIEKALDHLDEGADIRDIDVDWRANFFDKCRIVHDDDMQTLWAKILAGEANNPGTYSKRSVNFLADIDKRDAELFTELCRYVFNFKYTIENAEKIEFVPLIFDDHLLPPRQGFPTRGFTYHIRTPDLDHLDSIGMIRFAEIKDDEDQDRININSDGHVEASYFDESIRLSTLLGSNLGPPVGRVKLTQIGKELYPICGSTPIEGFFRNICSSEWSAYIVK